MDNKRGKLAISPAIEHAHRQASKQRGVNSQAHRGKVKRMWMTPMLAARGHVVWVKYQASSAGWRLAGKRVKGHVLEMGILIFDFHFWLRFWSTSRFHNRSRWSKIFKYSKGEFSGFRFSLLRVFVFVFFRVIFIIDLYIFALVLSIQVRYTVFFVWLKKKDFRNTFSHDLVLTYKNIKHSFRVNKSTNLSSIIHKPTTSLSLLE